MHLTSRRHWTVRDPDESSRSQFLLCLHVSENVTSWLKLLLRWLCESWDGIIDQLWLRLGTDSAADKHVMNSARASHAATGGGTSQILRLLLQNCASLKQKQCLMSSDLYEALLLLPLLCLNLSRTCSPEYTINHQSLAPNQYSVPTHSRCSHYRYDECCPLQASSISPRTRAPSTCHVYRADWKWDYRIQHRMHPARYVIHTQLLVFDVHSLYISTSIGINTGLSLYAFTLLHRNWEGSNSLRTPFMTTVIAMYLLSVTVSKFNLRRSPFKLNWVYLPLLQHKHVTLVCYLTTNDLKAEDSDLAFMSTSGTLVLARTAVSVLQNQFALAIMVTQLISFNVRKITYYAPSGVPCLCRVCILKTCSASLVKPLDDNPWQVVIYQIHHAIQINEAWFCLVVGLLFSVNLSRETFATFVTTPSIRWGIAFFLLTSITIKAGNGTYGNIKCDFDTDTSSSCYCLEVMEGKAQICWVDPVSNSLTFHNFDSWPNDNILLKSDMSGCINKFVCRAGCIGSHVIHLGSYCTLIVLCQVITDITRW